MSGSCWCLGDPDRCADAGQHTGPDAAIANALEGRAHGWTFGRCATCARETSLLEASRRCDDCTSSARRAYFSSPAATALAAAVLGVTPPAVAPVVELRPSATPARCAA